MSVDGLLVPLRSNGTKKSVYWLLCDGCCEGQQFFNALDPKAQARYLGSLYRLASMISLRREDYHQLKKHRGQDTHLAELKDRSSKTRFLLFEHYHRPTGEARIIMTHGFQKKEDALDPAEIDKAIAKRDYYLERVEQTVAVHTLKRKH